MKRAVWLAMLMFAAVCWRGALLDAQAETTPAQSPPLAVTHARIYPAPDAPPIDDGTVLIRAGRIVAVDVAARISIPGDAKIIDCEGLVVVAGFQNSHVHFIGPKWAGAAQQSPAKLSAAFAEMLTRYGFATAVDTASTLLANTTALRTRVETGEVAGPRILTAGSPLFPKDGIPFYLNDVLPPAMLALLDQPETADDAVAVVRRNISAGADIIKLFTGSLKSPTKVKPMSIAVASAAVAEAHRQGRLVFTHPSNLEGIRIAAEAGVDVLAHTASDGKPWSTEFAADLVKRKMALIPTLKLWRYEIAKAGAAKAIADRMVSAGGQQTAAFAKAGGQVLFGTDVGYMTDYDPSEEYVLMSQAAGLTAMQILSSLTTAPAQRFNEADRRGRVAVGMDADLVVLDADPALDVRNFAKVRRTIRGGRIVFPLATN
jgi:imidazolonepropionase-like amidohydrolase